MMFWSPLPGQYPVWKGAYPQERERMLNAATELANCSNLPSAEKLNWLLSPFIELVASSSFSLLHFPFFCPLSKPLSPSRSYTHIHTHSLCAISKRLTCECQWVHDDGLGKCRLSRGYCLIFPLVCSVHRSDITELMGLLHCLCFVFFWMLAAAQCQK